MCLTISFQNVADQACLTVEPSKLDTPFRLETLKLLCGENELGDYWFLTAGHIFDCSQS
jgi:hypothetical protein